MDVKILGTGCARCRRLEELTREVATEVGATIEVDHVIGCNMSFRASALGREELR